ncbi:hypothetical protein GCM10009753_76360 [Streptantibioticus ferralitis]
MDVEHGAPEPAELRNKRLGFEHGGTAHVDHEGSIGQCAKHLTGDQVGGLLGAGHSGDQKERFLGHLEQALPADHQVRGVVGAAGAGHRHHPHPERSGSYGDRSSDAAQPKQKQRLPGEESRRVVGLPPVLVLPADESRRVLGKSQHAHEHELGDRPRRDVPCVRHQQVVGRRPGHGELVGADAGQLQPAQARAAAQQTGWQRVRHEDFAIGEFAFVDRFDLHVGQRVG